MTLSYICTVTNKYNLCLNQISLNFVPVSFIVHVPEKRYPPVKFMKVWLYGCIYFRFMFRANTPNFA